MARMIGAGCEDWLKQLQDLERESDAIIARVVYDGAGVVADEFRSAINSLNFEYPVKEDDEVVDRSQEMRNGMSNGLTIFKHKVEGGVRSTQLGIFGYYSDVGITTKMFPNGVPYSYIAHSINTGTSKRPARPWIARTTRNAKEKAETKMAQTFDNEIKKLEK